MLLMTVTEDDGRLKGWRPVGGSIEFGERAADALKREFAEELNQEIRDQRLLCVLENLYSHNDSPGHEIVFVFEAEFADAEAYKGEHYNFVDGRCFP